MGAQDLSIFSLATLLVFLAPIIFINHKLKLSINTSLGVSLVRMGVQLGFVGLYLKFLFQLNSTVLNLFYLLIMVSVACHAIIRSSNLKVRLFFTPIFLALLIPFGMVLLFFNAMVVQLDNLFDAKYLIPVGGMLLGNCLRSIIVGLDRFYSGIHKDENTYLFSLSLLGGRIPALMPYFKEGFSAAVTPRIASMATIGLVSLPGMMTGQILGGSSPMVAIKYQIAIMLSIFYTEYFSTILSVLFSLHIGFHKMDSLNKDIFRK